MIQSKQELDHYYTSEDPWGYFAHPDDAQRKNHLLSLLPERAYQSTLDIGCGNGFVTLNLPGEQVKACDISARAIEQAKRHADKAGKAIDYFIANFFDLKPQQHGTFDLIVITGVLYPQYIGKANSLVHLIVDELLNENGVLVSCHIDDWNPPNFPYLLLDRSCYPYRDYFHRLDVYQK